MSPIAEPVRPVAARPQPIPLTALTCLRGAGKTTLLNRLLLKRPEPAYTSTLINESGKIGPEARAGSGRRVRRVVVGTTGPANPAPVLQTQMSRPVALRSFRSMAPQPSWTPRTATRRPTRRRRR